MSISSSVPSHNSWLDDQTKHEVFHSEQLLVTHIFQTKSFFYLIKYLWIARCPVVAWLSLLATIKKYKKPSSTKKHNKESKRKWNSRGARGRAARRRAAGGGLGARCWRAKMKFCCFADPIEMQHNCGNVCFMKISVIPNSDLVRFRFWVWIFLCLRSYFNSAPQILIMVHCEWMAITDAWRCLYFFLSSGWSEAQLLRFRSVWIFLLLSAIQLLGYHGTCEWTMIRHDWSCLYFFLPLQWLIRVSGVFFVESPLLPKLLTGEISWFCFVSVTSLTLLFVVL